MIAEAGTGLGAGFEPGRLPWGCRARRHLAPEPGSVPQPLDSLGQGEVVRRDSTGCVILFFFSYLF